MSWSCRASLVGVAILLAVSGVVVGTAAPRAPIPRERSLARAAHEFRADRRQLVEQLIAIAEDKSKPEPDRWTAVVALGDVGGRLATEYLVEHITLRLWSGDLYNSEATGKQQVCNWVLTYRRLGWDGEGSDWNTAQIILRAIGKPRTEQELVRYAYLLDISLGQSRYSDGMVATPCRALGLVEAELTAEQPRTIVAGVNEQVRAIRLKNLKELRRLLINMGR